MATARSDSRLVEVSAGPLFNFVGCAALVLVSIAAVTWGGTTAVGDPAGEIGSGIFLLGALAMLVFALAGRRNVRLFANDALVGCVGLFGGTRVIPRAELVEVRVAWNRYTGKGMGMWVFPTLHFRRRDVTDAFVTPAILYRPSDLQKLAAYLGLAIDLERPQGSA